MRTAEADNIDSRRQIVQSLREGAELRLRLLDNLDSILNLANAVKRCLQNGGKLLLIGIGGSAADAQHIAAEFVGRFSCERQPLLAIALTTDTSILTAIANDYGFDQVFARQTKRHGFNGKSGFWLALL